MVLKYPAEWNGDPPFRCSAIQRAHPPSSSSHTNFPRHRAECGRRLRRISSGKSLEPSLQFPQWSVTRRGDPKREDIVSAESRVEAQDIHKRAHEQACCHQQDECQGNFGRYQNIDPVPAPPPTLPDFLEVAGQIQAPYGNHGREAEEHAGTNGYGKGERENAPVEADVSEVYERRRTGCQDGTYCDPAKAQCHDATETTEQKTFGEQLTHQPGARCSERGANGGFVLALPGACHQEIRDIGASDQQHERYAAEEKQQSAAHLADVVCLKGKT